MDIAKLKVVELRAELAKRGLDQKGVKAVLVARLQEAMENEKGDEEEDEDEEGKEEDGVPLSQVQEQIAPPKSEPDGQDETSAQSMQSSEPEITHPEEDSFQFCSYQEESESKLGYEVNEDSIAHPPYSEASSDMPAATDEASVQSLDYSESKPGFEMSNDSSEPANSQSVTITDVTKQEEDSKDNFQNYEDSSECIVQEDSSSKVHYEEQSSDTWNQQDTNQQGEEVSQPFQMQESSIHLEDSNAQDALEANQKILFTEDIKSELKDLDSEKPAENETLILPGDIKSEAPDEKAEPTQIKQEVEETDQQIDSQGDQEMKPVIEDVQEPKAKDNEREKKNRWDNSRPTEARKRQRSPSLEKRKMSPVSRKPDDEPEFDEKAVLLSWYDSDLHMLINNENFFSASILTHSGFGYVWAGVRATYGFEKGKVYYEVRITENIKVPYLENEMHPNILRVGWSVSTANLQLGEYPLTYGFGGTGKISTNCQFRDYGKPFVLNDVVGVYLDMDSNQIEISYTINGEYQGVAYNISHEELKGQALFPHILSKNCCFEVNFGNREPWAQPLAGYTNVGEVPLPDRIPGPQRPEKREDCEVIMMVGLPASGKTVWATKYAEEHKEKMYNILGTNTLIEKMKVMGMPRLRNYSGRWEGLIANCTKCLNSLLEMGSRRRRNYIIDQTNVYPSAQRRKMRGFEGFVRRAVVIVPTDEELKARTAKREADEGKGVPDSALLEMKANFTLPEKGNVFDEVIYAELQEEEAKKLVAQYNKEGNDHGYFSNSQQQKRFRMDDNRGNDRRDFRNEGRPDGGDQRRMDNRGRPDNRGGPDGWRDRGFNNRRGGGDNRGWGPPRPGGWRNNRGGGGNWRGGPPNRFGDRGGHGSRDGRDRNRDYRDRRDGPPGGSGGKMPDRRGGDRGDDKNRPKMQPQAQQQSWGNQPQGGYNQGWGQNYNNQAWGNWNQGYNQQQWKGYAQQPQQQTWGQQGWGGQGWSNAGWNQQYYNQYQQNWTQQQTQGMTASTDTSGTGTDNTTMAAAYAGYGQTAQASSWPGYTTMGSTGYASVGSTGGASAGGGGGGGNTGGSASYSMQKQKVKWNFNKGVRKQSKGVKMKNLSKEIQVNYLIQKLLETTSFREVVTIDAAFVRRDILLPYKLLHHKPTEGLFSLKNIGHLYVEEKAKDTN